MSSINAKNDPARAHAESLPPTLSAGERASLTRRTSAPGTAAEAAAYAATQPAPLARPTAAPRRPRPTRQLSAPVTSAERDALGRANLRPLPAAGPTSGHQRLVQGLDAPAGQAAKQPHLWASVEDGSENGDGLPPSFEASMKTNLAGPEKAPLAHGVAAVDATHGVEPKAEVESTPKAEDRLDAAKLEADYRWAFGVLQERTTFARKVMPRVMQSAGMGLALAGAIHNPLLLLVAPALMVSGAILAAPAGWLLGKFFQLRARNNQAVKNALKVIESHDAKVKQVKNDLKFGRPVDDIDRLLVDVKEKVKKDKVKLANAEAFIGGNVFESGFRSAFVGPYKFWRKELNGTLDGIATALKQRRRNLDNAASEGDESFAEKAGTDR